MITVLTGENSFALQQALDTLVHSFMAKHGDIAVERLEGESASLERVNEALQSSPFLVARKLVVLRVPSVSKEFTDGFEAVLQNLAETTDVIIIEPKIDKRSSYYHWLKKQTTLEVFPELDVLGLARYLVNAAKEQGGELNAADARYMVDRLGANQQLLTSELNKLLIYDTHITRATIELLTEPTPQSKIFDLLDAAFASNPRRALELYHDQRAQKVDPSQIIAMITWQLRALAIIKAAGERKVSDIARESGLSPYTIQKSEHIADRLTMVRIKTLIEDLLTIDVRSKRERLDLDEALQNYLLALAQ